MPKTVTVTLHGMEGYGRNKTEAKADAARKLETAMNGTYWPLLLTAGEYAVLIYREPDGWNSCFIHDGQGFRRNICGLCHYGNDDRDSVERRVRAHLGDLTMDWRTLFSPDDAPEIVQNEQDRRELVRKAAWQRAYRHGEAEGHPDPHAYACAHDHEFMAVPA